MVEIEPYLNPELLDPRLRGRSDHPFGVPMSYDWSIINAVHPSGNTLSRRMKQMYFDTRGLIVQPREDLKWTEISPNAKCSPPKDLHIEKSHSSTYEVDFNGPQWHNYKKYRKIKLPVPRFDATPEIGRPGRPTIENTLRSLGTRVNEQAFMTWNVPEDFWSDEKPQKPLESASVNQKSRKCRQKQEIPRCNTTMPDMKINKTSFSRSKSVVDKTREGSERMPTTKDLLGDLNVSERRVLLKAIILNQWSGETDTFNKVMSPEAKRVVQKWLRTAKSQDRDFAMALFHKIAGNKRVDAEDPYIKYLLNAGETEWTIDHSPKPGFSKSSGESELRFIDLLKPKERRDQWSHSTWHHLPVYKLKSTGEHSGAMFEKLHKPQLVEYVLHPELG